MKRVEVLIEQALTTPSKSTGCGCGCGCGGKKKNSPILKEGKVKHLLSEGLNYHIDKKVPLFESEYRIGSEAHLSLIREARKLYSRGIIEVSEMDARLLETDLGHFGDYEGELVPLDLPMLNEEKKLTYNNFIQMVRDDMMAGAAPDEYPSDEKVKKIAKRYYNDYLQGASIDDLFEAELVPLDLPMLNEDYKKVDFENDFEILDAVGRFQSQSGNLFKDYDAFLKYLEKDTDYNPISQKEFEKASKQLTKNRAAFNKSEKSGFDKDGNFKKASDLGDVKEAKVSEAEYQGKEVQLNKPKRGGSKAYYVYVKDPKTKKVKKVSFGSGGLRAKLSNKEARKNFASRHNCKDKKDRTKAGYWSCNLPRYAKSLGMGANMNTFW